VALLKGTRINGAKTINMILALLPSAVTNLKFRL